MTRTLIIAEKPSVATDIASAVGFLTKHTHKKHKALFYYETEKYLITSASGHLYDIVDKNNDKRDRSFDELPILPEPFYLRPDSKHKSRIALIRELAERKDVDTIINACDAGREGELIFYNINKSLQFKQKIKRLWLQSLTPDAIIESLSKLRDNDDFIQLRKAAVARRKADWLIGINATEALTALKSDGSKYHAGRVKTPTLAFLVQRERSRKTYAIKPYWTLEVEVKIENLSYTGKYAKEQFDQENPEDSPYHIWDEKLARELESQCKSNSLVDITDIDKEIYEEPPELYDLNRLQQEAFEIYGIPPNLTLATVQSLYSDALLSYPRTESSYLPEDYVEVAGDILMKITDFLSVDEVDYVEKLIATSNNINIRDDTLSNGKSVRIRLSQNSSVFDNTKVSDHFAIIPTGKLPNNLNEIEEKIYDLIYRRFISAFMKPATIHETARISMIGNQKFHSIRKVVVESSWLDIDRLGKKKLADLKKYDIILPTIPEKKDYNVLSKEPILAKKTTSPPASYNYSTLIEAMKNASMHISDQKLSQTLSVRGGIGTVATRSYIINNLIQKNYMVNESNYLIPTKKAELLIDLLKELNLNELTEPELTAKWEGRLVGIEAGTEDDELFLNDIKKMAKNIVASAKDQTNTDVPVDWQ